MANRLGSVVLCMFLTSTVLDTVLAAEEDGKIPWYTTTWFIGTCAVVGGLIFCTCFCSCWSRLRHCCCGSGPTRDSMAIARKPFSEGVREFQNKYPILLPPTTCDTEQGIHFELTEYLRIRPSGTFQAKAGKLIFEAATKEGRAQRRASLQANELAITSKCITVQTNRILAGPRPSQVRNSGRVYYEVRINFLGQVWDRSGAVPQRIPTRVGLGWASKYFPPFEEIGDANFSLGLMTDGTVSSSVTGPDCHEYYLDKIIGAGDTVGCGYEVRDDAGIVEFYFTLNGERQDPLPKHWGVFNLRESEQFAEDAVRGQEEGGSNVKPEHQLRQLMLAAGGGYPTISVVGPAVLIPNLTGPFLYSPYVDAVLGSSPKKGRRNRRASIGTQIVAQKLRMNVVNMDAEEQDTGNAGKVKLSMDEFLKKKQEDKVTAKKERRFSKQAAKYAAWDPYAASPKTRRTRRLSAPTELIGNALKGWNERKEALKEGFTNAVDALRGNDGDVVAQARRTPRRGPSPEFGGRARRGSRTRRGSGAGEGEGRARRHSLAGSITASASDDPRANRRQRRSSAAGSITASATEGGGRRARRSSAAAIPFDADSRRSSESRPRRGSNASTTMSDAAAAAEDAGRRRRGSNAGRRGSNAGRRGSNASTTMAAAAAAAEDAGRRRRGSNAGRRGSNAGRRGSTSTSLAAAAAAAAASEEGGRARRGSVSGAAVGFKDRGRRKSVDRSRKRRASLSDPPHRVSLPPL